MDADDSDKGQVKPATKQSDAEPFDVATNDNEEHKAGPKKSDQNRILPNPIGGAAVAAVVTPILAGL